ncbi:MAG: PspC domain-containing protein [Bacteroidales bacterium]|nr:PspC domain-containing protein [Bacteroidales bacterium]
MNETYTININGRSFFIDIDAYQRLNDYLNRLKLWFKNKESGDEIISDIERRLVELFMQKINPETGVINIEIVEDAISTMGQPEDFEEIEEDNTTYNNNQKKSSQTYQTIPESKKLYRDIDNRIFGGVCSGLAAYFNIDTTIVRIIYLILTIFTAFAGIPVYVILWVLLPPAITTAQKLEMKGESINISNIEKKIKEEYEDVKNNFKNSEAYKRSEQFFQNKNKRDRNLVIFGIIIIGIFFLFPIIIFVLSNIFNGFHFSIHYPLLLGHHFKLWPIILILLLIGILSKNLMKTMLYIIGGLILLSIIIRTFGFFVNGFYL